MASRPRPCDLLKAYVHSFLEEDNEGEEAVMTKKKPPSGSRRRRGCWMDLGKEAAFLQQALAEYEHPLRCLHEPPAASAEAPSIPRIMHHIWLGSPFPVRFQAFRASWLEHHPAKDGWMHFLWTDDEVAPLLDSLRNKNAYLAAPNYGQKADILRYELLQRHGGIYVDVDMECVRSLDGLHGRRGPTFYAGFSNTGMVELNNGLIGAVPQHPILASLIERIHTQHSQPPPPPHPPSKSSPSSPQVPANLAAILGFLGKGEAAVVKQAVEAGERNQAAMGTIEATGPGLFTRVAAEYLQQLQQQQQQQSVGKVEADRIILAPPEWFYPMPNHVAQASSSSSSSSSSTVYIVPGVTYAVHHWARSWQQQEEQSHDISK